MANCIPGCLNESARDEVKRVYQLFTTRPQTADKNINVER